MHGQRVCRPQPTPPAWSAFFAAATLNPGRSLRVPSLQVKKILTTNSEAPLNVECLMNDIDAHGMITREVRPLSSAELYDGGTWRATLLRQGHRAASQPAALSRIIRPQPTPSHCPATTPPWQVFEEEAKPVLDRLLAPVQKVSPGLGWCTQEDGAELVWAGTGRGSCWAHLAGQATWARKLAHPPSFANLQPLSPHHHLHSSSPLIPRPAGAG